MTERLLVSGLLLLIPFQGNGLFENRFLSGHAPDRKQMFLILDRALLICPGCLNPVATFLEKLEASRTRSIIGLVTYPASSKSSESFLRILHRQIEGFRLGHRTEIPFFPVERTFIAPLAGLGTSLLVWETDGSRMTRYPFPISDEILDEILKR